MNLVGIKAHRLHNGIGSNHQIRALLLIEIEQERFVLIDSNVKLLFGEGGIGRDVIRELDHFDVKALLLSNFSGLRHDVGMRSCGHSNLDGLKLRSLGSCGGSRRRLRGSLLFGLSFAAGSKNRSRAQSNAEGQCGFKETQARL